MALVRPFRAVPIRLGAVYRERERRARRREVVRFGALTVLLSAGVFAAVLW